MNPSSVKKHLMMLHRLYFKTLSIYGEKVNPNETEKVKELQGILQYVQTKCRSSSHLVKTIGSKPTSFKKKSSTISNQEECSLGKRSPLPSPAIDHDVMVSEDPFSLIPGILEPQAQRRLTFDSFEEPLSEHDTVQQHFLGLLRQRADSGQGRDLISNMPESSPEELIVAPSIGIRNPLELLVPSHNQFDVAGSWWKRDPRQPEFSLQEDFSGNHVSVVDKLPLGTCSAVRPLDNPDPKMMLGVFVKGKFFAATVGALAGPQQTLTPVLTLKEVAFSGQLERTLLMYEIRPKIIHIPEDNQQPIPEESREPLAITQNEDISNALAAVDQAPAIMQEEDHTFLLDMNSDAASRVRLSDDLIEVTGWDDYTQDDMLLDWEPDIKMEELTKQSSTSRDSNSEESRSVAGSRPHEMMFSQPTKRRAPYRSFSYQDKLNVLQYAQEHGVEKASKEFSIRKSRIIRYQTNGIGPRARMVGRKTADPIMETKLVEWIQRYRVSQGSQPSKSEIKQQALGFSTNPNFRGSKGWCEKFLKRNGIQL